MTNDKSAEEIVRGLRDYARQYINENPYDYAPANAMEAARLIESQAAEIARLNQMLSDSFQGHLLSELQRSEARLTASQQRERSARNELCLKCGRYHEAHKGACDGCRWKEI